MALASDLISRASACFLFSYFFFALLPVVLALAGG
jgi:hypothetical protein